MSKYTECLKEIHDQADELCASFDTPECLTDEASLQAMKKRAEFIREELSKLF